MNYEEIIQTLGCGTTVVDVEALTGGVSATTHLLHLRRPSGDDERVVVRQRCPSSHGLSPIREYELLGELFSLGVAVQPVRHFVAPDTLVLEFVEGGTTLPAEAAQPLAETLAAIHATPISSLGELPLRVDPVPELLGWVDDTAIIEEWSQTHGGFHTERRSLLHGDFWPGNVIWCNEDIAAIIDWEDAAIGDPLSDVACTRLELAFAVGDESAEEFTTAYFEATELPSDGLVLWDLYVTSAALEFMEQWRLDPATLAARRSVTRSRQHRALQLLHRDIAQEPPGR